MAFIRRHSAAFSLLCVLAAAVAAPYLVPEDPDAAVFRSGIFGAILLAGCFLPARQSLERASRRELICGGAWALLFCAALSLGSELFAYGGLLPGFGSALRRAAVPLLAAPLFGALAAWALHADFRVPRRMPRLPMAAYALIFLLCWSPVLLAYFPGMLNYDFHNEAAQYQGSFYSAAHPLLYSVLQRALLDLGARLDSPTLGLLLATLARMAALAVALACCCAFAQRHGASAPALAGMTAWFALHPVFSVLAVSSCKDAPFACALVALTLLSFRALEDPAGFWQSKRRVLSFALAAVLTCHLRKNGLFALAFLFPALIAVARGTRLRTAALCASSAALCALLSVALNAWLRPIPANDADLYCVPAQQLVRAYRAGGLSQEDAAELESWYLYPTGLNVYPHLADRAKNNLDHERFHAGRDDYLALWARVGKTHAREYAEAFWLLNMGLWYPDDLSHASIYDDVSYEHYGYLQTNLYDPAAYGIRQTCLLPGVRALIERICTQNAYQRIPLVSLLFCTATPFWALALAAARLVSRRRTRALAAVSGALGVWLSYFFGACTLARYVLPLFCLAPVLLVIAFAPSGQKEVQS